VVSLTAIAPAINDPPTLACETALQHHGTPDVLKVIRAARRSAEISKRIELDSAALFLT
jgi:hypothetical protein